MSDVKKARPGARTTSRGRTVGRGGGYNMRKPGATASAGGNPMQQRISQRRYRKSAVELQEEMVRANIEKSLINIPHQKVADWAAKQVKDAGGSNKWQKVAQVGSHAATRAVEAFVNKKFDTWQGRRAEKPEGASKANLAKPTLMKEDDVKNIVKKIKANKAEKSWPLQVGKVALTVAGNIAANIAADKVTQKIEKPKKEGK